MWPAVRLGATRRLQMCERFPAYADAAAAAAADANAWRARFV